MQESQRVEARVAPKNPPEAGWVDGALFFAWISRLNKIIAKNKSGSPQGRSCFFLQGFLEARKKPDKKSLQTTGWDRPGAAILAGSVGFGACEEAFLTSSMRVSQTECSSRLEVF